MMDYVLYLLIGTYTFGTSEGIYVYKLHTETGEAEYVSMVKVDHPSYLAADKENHFIYAVTENGGLPSYANALSFDKETGTLKLLNTQETRGAAPCNIAIDSRGKFVVTANYNGGNLSVFPVQEDGTLAAASQVIGFEGKGVIPGRQDQPHLHCVQFSPEGTYLFATDLGTDHIYRFEVDYSASGQFLKEASLKPFEVAGGSGPRHFVFHPSEKYVYLINELSGMVTGFTYHNGDLKEFQTIKADPLHAQGSADIRITPDGRFLYASNRLKGDGIAIFSIDRSNGRLTKTGYQITGNHPRNFIITPNGKFLLVANKDSHSVQVFEINSENGLLRNTRKDIRLNMPVCLLMIND
jgi:6-phosphogluconolactonase (cycloisomerase 2 family)